LYEEDGNALPSLVLIEASRPPVQRNWFPPPPISRHYLLIAFAPSAKKKSFFFFSPKKRRSLFLSCLSRQGFVWLSLGESLFFISTTPWKPPSLFPSMQIQACCCSFSFSLSQWGAGFSSFTLSEGNPRPFSDSFSPSIRLRFVKWLALLYPPPSFLRSGLVQRMVFFMELKSAVSLPPPFSVPPQPPR